MTVMSIQDCRSNCSSRVLQEANGKAPQRCWRLGRVLDEAYRDGQKVSGNARPRDSVVGQRTRFVSE